MENENFVSLEKKKRKTKKISYVIYSVLLAISCFVCIFATIKTFNAYCEAEERYSIQYKTYKNNKSKYEEKLQEWNQKYSNGEATIIDKPEKPTEPAREGCSFDTVFFVASLTGSFVVASFYGLINVNKTVNKHYEEKKLKSIVGNSSFQWSSTVEDEKFSNIEEEKYYYECEYCGNTQKTSGKCINCGGRTEKVKK